MAMGADEKTAKIVQDDLSQYIHISPPPQLNFFQTGLVILFSNVFFAVVPLFFLFCMIYPWSWYFLLFPISYLSYAYILRGQTIFGKPWAAHIFRPLLEGIRRHLQVSVVVHKEALKEKLIKTEDNVLWPKDSDPSQHSLTNENSNEKKVHYCERSILAMHPHGILALFRPLFDLYLSEGVLPFLKPSKWRALAATVLFRIPVHRECALWSHCCVADKTVAVEHLEKHNNSLLITPGGELEQLFTENGKELLYLKRRKGFTRLAIQYNCPIIPIYIFGENDLFYSFKGLMNFRKWICQSFYICLIIFIGKFIYFPAKAEYSNLSAKELQITPLKKDEVACTKGIYSMNDRLSKTPFPTLPDHALRIVIGKPIFVQQQDSPQTDYVDYVHEKYVECLTNLYNTHKKYMGKRYETRELKII